MQRDAHLGVAHSQRICIQPQVGVELEHRPAELVRVYVGEQRMLPTLWARPSSFDTQALAAPCWLPSMHSRWVVRGHPAHREPLTVTGMGTARCAPTGSRLCGRGSNNSSSMSCGICLVGPRQHGMQLKEHPAASSVCGRQSEAEMQGSSPLLCVAAASPGAPRQRIRSAAHGRQPPWAGWHRPAASQSPPRRCRRAS